MKRKLESKSESKSIFETLQPYKKARLNYLNANKGFLSLKEASMMYYKDISEVIYDHISTVIMTGDHIIVNLHENDLYLKSYSIDTFNFCFHEMHYGLLVGGIDWFKHRNINTYSDFGIEHPFKQIQAELLLKGYYLQDVGHKLDQIVIGPRLLKPNEYNETGNYLWHGLDKLYE